MAEGMCAKQYHRVQASVNYLVSMTRDDCRYWHGKCAKFCADPGREHFLAQNQGMRYIKGTLGYGQEFVWNATDPPKLDGPLTIVAYSDSSFADDVDTCRTTLGHLIQVNGTTVCSSSKLSARVDSCVNHSELNAFADASGPTNS